MVDTQNVELVNLKVEPLDAEAFEPFGTVIREGIAGYPDIDGEISVYMLSSNKRDSRWNVMAYHHTYNQTFIPLVNAMVMCVSPAPVPSEDGQRMIVDYDATRAFLVNVGEAVEIKRGVGHDAIPATDEGCRFITITQRLPQALERVLISQEVDNDMDEIAVDDIELISLPEQDGRAFFLESPEDLG